MRTTSIQGIFLSESQSTSQVRRVLLLHFTGGETGVGRGWRTGLCIWQRVGQARSLTPSSLHILITTPKHVTFQQAQGTCSCLPSQCLWERGFVILHKWPFCPTEKQSWLQSWACGGGSRVPVTPLHFKQRSSKKPMILVAFGRTGWCFSELEGLFVMATYVPRKYSLLPLNLGTNESDSFSFHVA